MMKTMKKSYSQCCESWPMIEVCMALVYSKLVMMTMIVKRMMRTVGVCSYCMVYGGARSVS